MSEITLTSDKGKPVALEVNSILRIRPASKTELGNRIAKTFIGYAFDLYVMEDAAAVAAAVKNNGLTSLVQFINSDKSPLWCNAKSCEGPIPVPASAGARGAFKVGGKRQYVQNSPQEIHDLLAQNGGMALPIVDPDILSLTPPKADEVWDSNIKELSVGLPSE